MLCQVGSDSDILVGISVPLKKRWYRKSKWLYTNVAFHLDWIQAEMASVRDASATTLMPINVMLYLFILIIEDAVQVFRPFIVEYGKYRKS